MRTPLPLKIVGLNPSHLKKYVVYCFRGLTCIAIVLIVTENRWFESKPLKKYVAYCFHGLSCIAIVLIEKKIKVNPGYFIFSFFCHHTITKQQCLYKTSIP
jgi:hypothetical protein